jgi:hypothetical protein
MADFQFTDLTYWDIRNALPSFPAEIISLGFSEYPLDPFGADVTALTLLEATMSNFPPIFLNTTNGRHERLLPADGGVQIDVIDCAVAATNVKLFETVDGTGTVEILKEYTGAVTIGKVGGWFNFGGGVHVQEALETHGTTLLSGSVELGSIGTHNILFNGKISSGTVFFTASAPHSIVLDQGALTLQTTTSGKIAINSVHDLDFDAGTSSAFNAGTTMSFVSVGAAEFKATGAAAALTLGGFGATVPLNAAAPNNALVGFTASSIVGALNELRGDVHDTVPSATVGEAAGVVLGDLVCLDDDAGTVKLYKCDNADATRNRPVGVALESKAVGATCTYTTTGRVIVNTAIPAAQHGNYVFMDTAPNAGKVTTTVPVAGTIMVVGVVAAGGVGAGTDKIIYQPLLPTTF